MSFTVNSTGRLALLNVATQGVHLWDLQVIALFNFLSENIITLMASILGSYLGSQVPRFDPRILHDPLRFRRARARVYS